MPKNNCLKFSILPIFLILIFAGILRLPTFVISHNNFDEMAYLSLAQKLDKYSFRDFERHFDLHYIEIIGNEFFRAPVIGERSVGNFIIGSKVTYEAMSPTHRPPGFSYLLMLSHKIFANGKLYLASNINFNPYFYSQFYACLVPYFFSLALIFVTYLLGRMLFSEGVGLCSALFLSLTPTELMVSHKIWTETTLAFFTVLAVIFYFLSIKRDRIFYAFLSGAFASLAILNKLSGGFIVVVILIYHFWQNRKNLLNFKGAIDFILDRKIILFLLAIVIIAGWWLAIYKVNFGSGMPSTLAKSEMNTSYLYIVGHRPWFVYLVNIPYQFPAYIFLYISFVFCFFSWSSEKRKELLFLIIWFLFTWAVLTFKIYGKEERYLMPAYPAIAILSSFTLIKIKGVLNSKGSYKLGSMIFYIIVIFSGAWSLKLSIPLVLSRSVLSILPF